MNLRTKTILLCTLVGLTFSATSFANTEINPANTGIELNITQEIEQNLQAIMAEMQGPGINQEAIKQLKLGFLEQHTNRLVKNARNELPEYKFKVILTD